MNACMIMPPMSKNPRFIKLETNDVVWFYTVRRGSEPSQSQLVSWFKANIEKANPDGSICVLLPNPTQAYAQDRRGDDTYLMSGISGTSVIFSSGFNSPEYRLCQRLIQDQVPGYPVTLSLYNEFLERLASGKEALLPDLSHLRKEMLETPTDPIYWSSFEEELDQQPERRGGIDIYIFPKEKQVYVHLELGSSLVFATEYHAHSIYIAEFNQWLTNPLKPLIKRTVFTVDENGVVSHLPTLAAKDIAVNIRSDVIVQRPYFATSPTCPPGMKFCASCSMTAGTLTEFDPGTDTEPGYAAFDIEGIILKPYCADASKPCPS